MQDEQETKEEPFTQEEKNTQVGQHTQEEANTQTDLYQEMTMFRLAMSNILFGFAFTVMAIDVWYFKIHNSVLGLSVMPGWLSYVKE